MKMDFLKYIKRGRSRKREQKPLRVEGVRTPMTPQPDEAELAAQALLETAASGGKAKGRDREAEPVQGTAEYYRRLSERIRRTRAAEARLTRRYLAYCEEQLSLPTELYRGQTAEMEQELYKRQAVAEREGGELLRRWQHCLAECIVRNMTAAGGTSEGNEDS